MPTQVNASNASGGQFTQAYTLTNDDGTPLDLSTATFEFVIRPAVTDTTHPALISVTSTAATAQGNITITANTVTVVLTPTATALLGHGACPYALWIDPGLTDAVPLVTGMFISSLVAAP